MFAGLQVGLILVGLAVVLVIPVLVVIWYRRWPRNVLNTTQPFATPIAPDPSNSINEAIVLVQPGGRLEYINELAHEWFGLRRDEIPDLERLIRQTRPAEEFLILCAHQGQKRLS